VANFRLECRIGWAGLRDFFAIQKGTKILFTIAAECAIWLYRWNNIKYANNMKTEVVISTKGVTTKGYQKTIYNACETWHSEVKLTQLMISLPASAVQEEQ